MQFILLLLLFVQFYSNTCKDLIQQNSTKNEVHAENIIHLKKDIANKTEINTSSFDQEWAYNTDILNTTSKIPQRIFDIYDNLNLSITKNRLTNEGCQIRILFNTKKTSPHIITFNMESLKEDERVLNAELMFYFKPAEINKGLSNRQSVLRVYQLASEGAEATNVTYLRKTIDVHKLSNVVYVSNTKPTWQVFKIRKSVESWLTEKNNYGLVMTISASNGNGYIQNLNINDTNTGEFRTFMVVTTTKRYYTPGIQKPIPEIESDGSCSKIPYSIDFTKITNLNKMIITPKNYMAYDCSGKCNVESVTNHIKMLQKMQNFIQTMRNAFCTPINYLPLPIMFYDKYGNVVIKVYKDMIVNHCGCR